MRRRGGRRRKKAARRRGRPPPPPPRHSPGAVVDETTSRSVSEMCVKPKKPTPPTQTRTKRVWPPDVLSAAALSVLGRALRIGRIQAATDEAVMDAAWRVWAIDIPAAGPAWAGGGKPKQYFALSVPAIDVLLSAVDASARCVYEVLSAGRPCWLYLDLETAVDSAPALADAAVAADALVCRAQDLLGQEAAPLLGEGERLEVDVVTLGCSRSHRFSRHVLLKPHLVGGASIGRTPAPLAGLTVAKKLAKVLAEGDGGALVDTAVYHDKRAFRLVHCHKLHDDDAPFIVNELQTHPRIDTLAACLVHPPLDPAVRVRLIGTPPAEMTPGAKPAGCNFAPRDWPAYVRAAGTARPLLDLIMPGGGHGGHPAVATVGGAGPPPEPFARIAKYAAAVLRQRGCDAAGTIRAWEVQRSERPAEALLVLAGSGRGVCGHIGRAHSSRPINLTIDLHTYEVWQRCADATCVVFPNKDKPKLRTLSKTFLGVVPYDLMLTTADVDAVLAAPSVDKGAAPSVDKGAAAP